MVYIYLTFVIKHPFIKMYHSEQIYLIQVHSSIIAEKFWLDDDADAELGMEFLVGKETLAVAVVVLHEDILVVAREDAVAELKGGVVVLFPASALGQDDRRAPARVGRHEGCPHLIDAAVVKDVAVVLPVDYGNPEFAVNGYAGVNHDAAAERHLVPRPRFYPVAPVALMLKHEVDFPDKPVFDKQRLGQPYTGIEIEVGHRHRVFKHVPETLLRIEKKQVGSQRQSAARESLRYRNLELYIGVFLGDALPYRGTEDEIIVLVQSEIRPFVKCLTDTVAVDVPDIVRHNLSRRGKHRTGKRDNRNGQYLEESFHNPWQR